MRQPARRDGGEVGTDNAEDGGSMNDTIRPRSVIDAESAPTARERAVQRGWHIDPDASPGPPHPIGACSCNGRRRCGCNCHGKTFNIWL